MHADLTSQLSLHGVVLRYTNNVVTPQSSVLVGKLIDSQVVTKYEYYTFYGI